MTIAVDNKLERPLDESSSDGSTSSPLASSRETSSADLKWVANAKPTKKSSLQDRNKIPLSFYMSSAIILTAQFVGGVWSIDTLKNWLLATTTAGESIRETLAYLRDLMQAAARGEVDSWSECMFACAIAGLVACLLYVLIGAPLRAGFWTGRKAMRHKMHRYMGLSYLLQYGPAWVVYCTHYEQAKDSYLLHFIAINGMNWGVML
jgi:hypothetical protein